MSSLFLRIASLPRDIYELERIERLIDKIAVFNEKIIELDKKLDDISKKSYYISGANNPSPFNNITEMKDYVLKAFFSDIENKPFTEMERFYIRKYSEIKWEGYVFKRNIPCEICGENRSIDRCHIIPNKLGGLFLNDNLLFLCPTHHRLFDRFLLSKAEWCVINWNNKSVESAHYAKTVTLKKHMETWDKLKAGDYQQLVSGVIDKNDIAFIKYHITKITNLFYHDVFSPSNNWELVVDKNLHELYKKILSALKKLGYIVFLGSGKNKLMALTIDDNNVSDDLAKSITLEIY